MAFTHIDEKGSVRMVDVSQKISSRREAIAQAKITMNPETFAAIQENSVKKGNVLETARIAGIMAAKKTGHIIPMCHPLNITHIEIDFFPQEKERLIKIKAVVRINDRTGVEMEALTAASVAALTIYDMCKSSDKEMIISDICLLRKSGGKSGTFSRNSEF